MQDITFGTDGIRGEVGKDHITPEAMLRIGAALGRVLAREERPSVVIGKDTRISGYMFESALEAGLVSSGCDVLLAGPMPTPGVAVLTRSLRASAGIVISASHNPHHDNGVKFFSGNGTKLSDDKQHLLEEEIKQALSCCASEYLGKARRISDAGTRYIEFCKATVDRTFSLKKQRIVLDCAHGATYHIAPKVFSELGAEVVGMGVSPDGLNINQGVGSTHMDAIKDRVLAEKADLGIAFDGDGDRVQMVDRHGRVVDGDHLIWVLAKAWQAQGRLKGPVVGTLMTNLALEEALKSQGIAFLRADVGDRYVHQQLLAYDGVLGGEASGHVLVLDRIGTGDGIVSALQVMEALAYLGQTLDEALADYTPYPQQSHAIHMDQAKRLMEEAKAQALVFTVNKNLEGRGRVVVRPSGTEPVLRVTVESNDEALCAEQIQILTDGMTQIAEQIGLIG